MTSGVPNESSWLGASKPIRHKPVEAHVLFGRNRLGGCGQVGKHVTHDIGETRECFNLGGREPGQ